MTTTSDPKVYLTGGALRNRLMDLPVKDLDFAVEAKSYGAMVQWLVSRGVRVWQERPQFYTLRGQLPKNGLPNLGGDFGGDWSLDRSRGQHDVDFTLCRTEGPYTDGRHPDWVHPSSLVDDLGRRDFTVNAMAMSADGELVDPFDGQVHCKEKHLRTVGNPHSRFMEDPLRLMRAWRFCVTLNMHPADSLVESLPRAVKLLGPGSVSMERVREEMHRAMAHAWGFATYSLMAGKFHHLGMHVVEAYPDLWLKPSTEKH